MKLFIRYRVRHDRDVKIITLAGCFSSFESLRQKYQPGGEEFRRGWNLVDYKVHS